MVPVLGLPTTAVRRTDSHSTPTTGQTWGLVLHAGGVIEIKADVTTALLKFQFHLMATGSNMHCLPAVMEVIPFFLGGLRED